MLVESERYRLDLMIWRQMRSLFMKTDTDLRHDVEQELEWDPRLDEPDIGVAVKRGIVTLSGQVRSYAERWAAQDAAQSVGGVKALANEIEVQLPTEGERSDTEIAEAALTALRLNMSVPVVDIKLAVHDGWLTLTGQVAFWYQKQAAETTVRNIQGIKGIANEISVNALVSTSDIKSRIEEAFRRHAQIDADKIRLQVAGGTVILEGEVESWWERDHAESAVWAAPGVTSVQDRLVVRP
jgi:osmotically-inducible protein OsmY